MQRPSESLESQRPEPAQQLDVTATTVAVDDMTVLRSPREEWKLKRKSLLFRAARRLSLNSLNDIIIIR